MKKLIGLCILLIMIIGLLPSFGFSTVIEVDNLTRDKEPIIIKGSTLPSFINVSVNNIFVLAYNNGFKVIPFQIDQRMKVKNKMVYVDSEGTNVFDSDDEICFLSKDMGDRVDISTWPGQTQNYLYEVTAYDGMDNLNKAFAYIVQSSQLTPSPVDYITLNSSNPFNVESSCYKFVFEPNAPHIRTEVRIKSAFGGNGLDMIDRLKTRLATTIFQIWVGENSVVGEFVKDADIIDGKVRVIEQIMGKALLDTTIFSNIRHYPEMSTNDLTLDLTPTVIIQPIWLRYSTDLNPQMKDSKVITNWGGRIQKLTVDGIQDHPYVRPVGSFFQVWSPTYGSSIQCIDMNPAQELMYENPDSLYFFWNDGAPDPTGYETGDGQCWGEHGVYAAKVPKDRLTLYVKEYLGLSSENAYQQFGAYYFDSLQVSVNYNYKNTQYTIDLQPVNPNITLPKTGGKITFDAVIKNLTQSTVSLKAWVKAVLPNGTIYPQLVLGPAPVTLTAGQSKTFKNLVLSVPGMAFAGDYSIMGHIGPTTTSIYHTDSFVFTKLRD